MAIEQNTGELQDLLSTVSNLPNIADYIPVSSKGAPSGVAELDENGIVPADQLSHIVNSVTSPVTIIDRTEYRLTDITNLEFVYPSGNFEVWMNISFASTGTISVVLPSETQYIGTQPSFENGQTWEISIKDGVAICWRVA